ncbi:MAG: NAD(P)H-hydrate dehydratase, partial [candidate division Zixibacteria bacterium RBG_16_40_9]
TLGVPETLNSIFEIKLTEVITKPLPDVGKRGALALRGLGAITPYLDNSDCHAIGPGLGQHFETFELVRRLVTSRIKKPLVLDADALNAFAKDSTPLKNLPYPLTITPHIGELSRLINLPIEEIARDRINIARKVAQEFNLILVFKGAPTLVAEPSGQVYVNSTGNPGMATAGSGDVLTGMMVGLLGQKLKLEKDKSAKQIALESALAGVYLHGLCGDLAEKEKTEYGLIAGDILENIPKALKTIIN